MILIFGNIVGPAVEELYFRGYLLPRLSRFKVWAVPINSVLFALYHFYSPWDVITRSVGILPISYTAYKKKNLYIGMVVHWTLNTLSSISLLALIFK
jgi:membrane protease YdiL (CAAX protease family)